MKLSELYDKDEYLWRRKMIERIDKGQELDLEHIKTLLIEMSAREHREIKNYLRTLLLHLLKFRYQPERRSTSWEITIDRCRVNILDFLQITPSIRQYAEEALPDAYSQARTMAKKETALPLRTFPEECHFSLEALLRANRYDYNFDR
jgi:hypothetical protein